MIQELTEMMVERLQAYKAASKDKAFPKRVIVYRDGVSEVCNFGYSRLINLFIRGNRVSTRKSSKRSSIRKSRSLSGRSEGARPMTQKSPSSFVESDTIADSTHRRLSKNQITETPFPAQSKTEASRPRSCLTSTSKRIPAFKGTLGLPTTSSSTTRITSMPT